MWIVVERLQHIVEPVMGKVSVENDDRLARKTERQLKSRENYQPFLERDCLTGLVHLVICCLRDVRKHGEVVVIGDGDCVQAIHTRGANEVGGPSFPLCFGLRAWPIPVRIPRRVNLKIRPVEVCAIVVKISPAHACSDVRTQYGDSIGHVKADRGVDRWRADTASHLRVAPNRLAVTAPTLEGLKAQSTHSSTESTEPGSA